MQAEEHNGFLDALLDVLQSEQDANLRLSSTFQLRRYEDPHLHCRVANEPSVSRPLGVGPELTYARVYSCYLRQESRQSSVGRHRSLPKRTPHTRRREGQSPRPTAAHPSLLPRPDPPTTHPHPAAHSALGLPRKMAFLHGFHHPAPEHKRTLVRPRRPAVSSGYLPCIPFQGW